MDEITAIIKESSHSRIEMLRDWFINRKNECVTNEQTAVVKTIINACNKELKDRGA